MMIHNLGKLFVYYTVLFTFRTKSLICKDDFVVQSLYLQSFMDTIKDTYRYFVYNKYYSITNCNLKSIKHNNNTLT